jgi:secreted trypsin-like serine protease
VFVNSTTIKYSKYEYYRKAIKWIVHPGRQKQNDKNDIGLIFLDAPVVGVPLVKMNKNANIPVSMETSALTAIGLGVTGVNTTTYVDDFFPFPITTETYTEPDKLMQIAIDALPTAACKKVYSSYFIGEFNLCTDTSDDVKKGACYGDSGGPLLMTKSSAGEDVQVGIISWGSDGCGGYGPDVHTRVSYFAGWVDDQICTYSKSKPRACPTLKPTRKPSTKPVSG